MSQYNSPYPAFPGSNPSTPIPQQRRRFPFFLGYVMWFSPALWRDAGRRWGGIGFFYMLILLAASWAVVMGVGYPKLLAFVRNEMPKMAAEVPTIDIKDGVATADVEQPYYVRDPDTNKVIFVIDTTGATTEPPEVPSFLLTRDSLIIRDRNKVQTLPLKELPTMRIDSGTVQGFFDKVVRLYWPLGYPTAVGFSMFWRFLQMLLYGLIAMAIGSGVRPPLGFAAGMRLAAIAVTPVILIDTLTWAAGFPLGCVWWFIAIGLEIVLLVFMVKANDEGAPASPPGGFYPGQAPYAPQGYAPQGYAPPAYSPPPAPPGPPGYPPPR